MNEGPRKFHRAALGLLLVAGLALALPLVGPWATASADSFALDPDFGTAGVIGGEGIDVIATPEPFVAPGGGLFVSNFLASLDRFDRNGEADRGFAYEGRFSMPEVDYFEPSVEDVAIQGGLPVIAGWFSESDVVERPYFEARRPFLRRLTAKGTIDRTFGRNGKVPASTRRSGDVIFKDVEVAGGSILAVGGGGASNDKKAKPWSLIKKYDRDGKPDLRFADRGTFRIQGHGNRNRQEFNEVRVVGRGRILAAGYDKGRTIVVRLLPSGVRDKGFGGGDGVVSYPMVPQGSCYFVTDDSCMPPVKLAVGKTGRIYVLDYTQRGNKGSVARLAAFSRNGSRIRGFADRGIKRFRPYPAPTARAFYPMALAFDPRNRLVLMGSHAKVTENWPPSDSHGAILRLLPNGKSDPDFGNRGMQLVPVSGFHTGLSLTFDPAGRLYVTGVHDGQHCAVAAVARLLPSSGVAEPDTWPGVPNRCS